MVSPGERRGLDGHIMASFDSHHNCARCCEKGLGQDACVAGNPYQICEGLFSTLILWSKALIN